MPPAHRVLLEQWGHRVAELLALYNFVLSMLALTKSRVVMMLELY